MIQVDLISAESAYIAANVTVGTTNGTAISGTGSGHQVLLSGAAVGGHHAFKLGNSSTDDAFNSVHITASGFAGSPTLTDGFATIFLQSCGSRVMNDRTIISGYAGIDLSGPKPTLTRRVTNHGLIEADQFGILATAGVESRVVVNNGTISGGTTSFSDSMTSNNRVINHGLMDGNVLRGAGNDFDDGRGGQIICSVQGGSGFDFFKPRLEEDIFEGDDDTDTLHFRSLADITVFLDNSGTNTRTALGDTYTGIEAVIGTPGRDMIYCDASDNTLRGIDVLSGGDGADTLQGNRGNDTLTGGLGDDVLQFDGPTNGIDTITDFRNALGNNDRFQSAGSHF